MQKDQLYRMLNDVFRDVFEDANLVITKETTSKDIERWTSLTHLQLIVAIEKQFGLKFSLKEVIGFQKVEDMVACICNKLPV